MTHGHGQAGVPEDFLEGEDVPWHALNVKIERRVHVALRAMRLRPIQAPHRLG